MDIKELNKLIDRISLTGPGGIDKIKKVLKEVADSSDSDSVEFVIAQALNDLNERIESLQTQIAQQDDLRIEIGQPDALTTNEKKQLIDAHERGVLMDVLLVLYGGDTIARVITDDISGGDTVYIIINGEITSLDVSE